MHISSKSKIEIESKLQSDGTETGAWSKRNKLLINYGKSTTMAVGTRQKLNNIEALHITIEDCQIMPVKSQKLLCVYIDEHLNWTPHVDHLCATISSRSSLLKQLAQYVLENIQKTSYQGYILSLIDYDSNTWGATSNTNVERLNKLQKRAARIILNADYITPSTAMFKRPEWMSINNRLKYNKAVFTYKAMYGLTPSYISDLLKPIAKTGSRTLRSSETRSLTVPRSRTALCEGSCSLARLLSFGIHSRIQLE